MAYRNRLNGIKFLQISHFMHAPFILPHNIYMRSCDHKLCDVTSPNVYHAEHRLTGFLSVIFSDSEKHIFFSLQEAFEKCWAHSPLRAVARPNFTLPFTRCRYCRTPPLSHAACASMSTTTTTTTTTRDRGDRYGPIEWAQKSNRKSYHRMRSIDLLCCQ